MQSVHLLTINLANWSDHWNSQKFWSPACLFCVASKTRNILPKKKSLFQLIHTHSVNLSIHLCIKSTKTGLLLLVYFLQAYTLFTPSSAPNGLQNTTTQSVCQRSASRNPTCWSEDAESNRQTLSSHPTVRLPLRAHASAHTHLPQTGLLNSHMRIWFNARRRLPRQTQGRRLYSSWRFLLTNRKKQSVTLINSVSFNAKK